MSFIICIANIPIGFLFLQLSILLHLVFTRLSFSFRFVEVFNLLYNCCHYSFFLFTGSLRSWFTHFFTLFDMDCIWSCLSCCWLLLGLRLFWRLFLFLRLPRLFYGRRILLFWFLLLRLLIICIVSTRSFHLLCSNFKVHLFELFIVKRQGQLP